MLSLCVQLSEMTSRIGDLMRNTDYDTFQRVVNRTIGSEPGIEQIAAMFRMTKCAVHLVGISTSAARSIKEMAIRYFEDHFAPWVVDEGGWVSHSLVRCNVIVIQYPLNEILSLQFIILQLILI